MRIPEGLTIPIELDRTTRRPLQDQLAEQLAGAVDRGLLAGGCRLPSTRTLAERLHVSRGVALAAYEILYARGYLEGRRGSGSYVAARRSAPPDQCRPPAPAGEHVDCTPGQATGEGFPLAAWRAAWRHASFQPPPVRELPRGGLPELRRAVAGHLRRTRGLGCDEHQVLITSGLAHGLRLVLDALGGPGRVAVQDPAPPVLRQVVADSGRRAVALPVDRDGGWTGAVPPACTTAVVSPDGGPPFGAVVSALRRQQLADWARREEDHLVVEVVGVHVAPAAAPLPRLSNLAGVRTAVVGDFRTVFAPSLRVGYVLLHRDLLKALPPGAFGDEQPSHVAQSALAHLLTEGSVLRRLHQLERLFSRKDALVRAALAPLGPAVRLAPPGAAGTVVVHLPDRLDAECVHAELHRRGVLVPTLASFHLPGRPAGNALVLGHGHLPEQVLRGVLDELVDVLHVEHPAVERAIGL
ncbi:aminotransferase-like domain-containing protein [Saccharothrix syringae]|uniref:PLP-dependent aminotransferase family protein n=1 Tax=Saccharothrix syringae TaxID=103733 RepID=A0A5Q0H230_SACSY|nr:PLP-dependent aminotransferase family protein [Saccharothrix syringae]QFZ20307.1 PLP-dependent aminotransferase family protein [Saccharothrix syringae]